MRIGILIPEFPSQTHAFFWREVQALRQDGTEVFIISTRKPKAPCPHEFARQAQTQTHYLFPPFPGISLFRIVKPMQYIAALEQTGLIGKAKATGYLLCAADLARFCRKNRIEHIHVHSCAEAAHVAAMSYLMAGPTYSLHLHGDLPVYGTNHASKMRNATFISADAKPMQRQVIEQVGIEAERTCTIWMGVDTNRFTPANEPNRPPLLRIVTIARLYGCKGHIHALRAIRLALDRGTKLQYAIAGQGPTEQLLRQEITRLNLSEHVKMLGSVSEGEVLKLLRESDVYLLPSVGIGEASPVAVMEAMACGIPIISSIIGGTPDMIRNGIEGILVNQADEPALTEAIIHLATNPAQREQMGLAARTRATTLFDHRQCAQKILTTIQQHQKENPTLPPRRVLSAAKTRIS